jgi:hypothetical protein
VSGWVSERLERWRGGLEWGRWVGGHAERQNDTCNTRPVERPELSCCKACIVMRGEVGKRHLILTIIANHINRYAPPEGSAAQKGGKGRYHLREGALLPREGAILSPHRIRSEPVAVPGRGVAGNARARTGYSTPIAGTRTSSHLCGSGCGRELFPHRQ